VSFYLGIDGGGTKTSAILVSEDGSVLSRAEGPGTNYHRIGVDTVIARLSELVSAVCRDIGGTERLRTAVIGLAGAGRPEDLQALAAVPARTGLPETTMLTHDARIALAGALERDVGVVLIAGTGSIAYGRAADGTEARAGGWGLTLGDEGSGYGIGLAALRAVCRAHDGRDDVTTLRERVLSRIGLASPDRLVRWVADATPADIADLAGEVVASAADGDATAQAIVCVGADELALAACAVLNRLSGELAVGFSGGMLLHHDSYRRAVADRIADRRPGVEAIRALRSPAEGAALLARQLVAREGAP